MWFTQAEGGAANSARAAGGLPKLQTPAGSRQMGSTHSRYLSGHNVETFLLFGCLWKLQKDNLKRIELPFLE